MRGEGLDRQIDATNRWIDEHNLTVLRTYSDRGVSAFRGKNRRVGELALILTGLVPVGPAALVLAITAGLGGIALSGSHQNTRAQIAARIRAQEARCAALIDALALQTVGR